MDINEVKAQLFALNKTTPDKLREFIRTLIADRHDVPEKFRTHSNVVSQLNHLVGLEEGRLRALQIVEGKLQSGNPPLIAILYENEKKIALQKVGEAVTRASICNEMSALLDSWATLSPRLAEIREQAKTWVQDVCPKAKHDCTFAENPTNEELLAWAQVRQPAIRTEIETLEDEIHALRRASVEIELLISQLHLETKAQWPK